MSNLVPFEAGSPTKTCLCGCRGNKALHEAYETGLAGELYRRKPRALGKRPGIRKPVRRKPYFPRKLRPRPFIPRGRHIRDTVYYPFPDYGEPSQVRGDEYIRWVQDCLNYSRGLTLPVNGISGPETRSAVRSFQRQQGLRVSGIVGPDTEKALKAACRNRDDKPSSGETEFDETFGEQPWELRGQSEMELPDVFKKNYDTLMARMGKRRTLWDSGRCFLLSQWNNAPRQGGIYLLIFRRRSRRGHIGYVGMSGNLYERLRGYNRDVIALGLEPDDYVFCWHVTPQYRLIEQSLRRTLNPTGLVTNQREFEMEQAF